MKGILPIFKPRGLTSHDIIDKLRRITGERKIGHAGTLDPMAEGVLVVAIGKNNTKQLSKFVAEEKEYLTLIELGKESSTDDEEGDKLKIKVKKIPDFAEVERAVLEFVGSIEQLPPQYSAIKISGVRAYKLARQGQVFKMKPRKAEIRKINIIKYNYPELVLMITTGPGVYIRSIARDIGGKLKTGGYLKNLRRVRVGKFTAKNAIII